MPDEDRPGPAGPIEPGRRGPGRGVWRDAGPYMGLGWVLAVSVGLGTVGGLYADRRFGTKPWMTLIGLIAGMAVGFVNVLRSLLGPEGPGRRGPSKNRSSDAP
jgi:putative F0F1-ATPase subunit (Ca2+/Mg2+ transporter)